MRALIEEQARGRSSGQGFRVSPEVRTAIEGYAMERAKAYYERRGWSVEDVSASRPYDLHCTKPGGKELRVEVKGTTGGGSEVLLTPNEVTHAREHYPRVALFVVAGVETSDESGGLSVTGGGAERDYEPWQIDEGDLAPLGYSYALPRRRS